MSHGLLAEHDWGSNERYCLDNMCLSQWEPWFVSLSTSHKYLATVVVYNCKMIHHFMVIRVVINFSSFIDYSTGTAWL